MHYFEKALVSLSTAFFMAIPVWAQNNSPERYIVKYDVSYKSQIETEILRANGEIILSLENHRLFSVEMTPEDRTRLDDVAGIEFIEVDPKRYLMTETIPYGVTMVEAPLVAESLLTDRRVCIIDSGYSLGHTDLQTLGVTGDSITYANGNTTGNWFNDGFGHGTMVAGIIAALGGNNIGISSINPTNSLHLHVVKAFNNAGYWGYGSTSILALDQCLAAGADVINMSYGGPVFSQAENQVFIFAQLSGVLLIAAAGNSGLSDPNYPAALDAVMSVGSVDSLGVIAPDSTHHLTTEISAPGVATLSTSPNNQYATDSGTSFAAPHVSGVAALVWGHYPNCTGHQIRQALGNTAEDKGAPGRDQYYGKGIVRAKEAYDALAASGCTVPSQVQQLQNGVVQSNLSASAGSPLYFTMNVAADNASSSTFSAMNDFESALKVTNLNESFSRLSFGLAGGTGNADLYVKYGSKPTQTEFDCRSSGPTNEENCEFMMPREGFYYVMVEGTNAFSGVNLLGEYEVDTPPLNTNPVANFTFNCTLLECFFDGRGSSDTDGQIVSYVWDYGDGNTASGIASLHDYAGPSSYNVTLTVTDDAGYSSQSVQSVEVIDPTFPHITLTALPITQNRKKHARLEWSRVTSRNVDIYTNGKFSRRTRNDGQHIMKVDRKAKIQSFKICESKSKIDCSETITISFN